MTMFWWVSSANAQNLDWGNDRSTELSQLGDLFQTTQGVLLNIVVPLLVLAGIAGIGFRLATGGRALDQVGPAAGIAVLAAGGAIVRWLLQVAQ